MECPPNHDRSIEINHIMAALAKAQGMYKPLVCNQQAPGGMYANLQAILNAVRDALSANALAIYFHIKLLDEGSGAALLYTILGHESGQYISSVARVIAAKTDRQMGNIYEIHKRFHALMILGIAPSENDPMAFDDNGTEMADEQVIEKLKKPPTSKKELKEEETITKDQYNDLMIELDGYGDLVKDIMEAYDIETLADLPKSEYHMALGRIRRIKRTQDEYHRKMKL